MATTDADALLIDANVLVYANVTELPFHAQALNAIQAAHLRVDNCLGRSNPAPFLRPSRACAMAEGVKNCSVAGRQRMLPV